MVAKFLLVLCGAAALASAIPLGAEEEHYAPAHYSFEYSVHDSHTGDIKQQQESREGDAVQGSYSLLQPDGLKRLVHYSADKEHGFTADVTYEGHKQEHQPAVSNYHAAPLAKLSYVAAPAAQLTYHAAPSAQLSYHSAPVAKVSYAAAPAAQVTYHAAAPVAKISYAAVPDHQVTYHAAPVAKIAYSAAPAHISAPVHKIAYTENLGHVTFSSPIISYHH